jgi:esterase/lipase superfamily enzyme
MGNRALIEALTKMYHGLKPSAALKNVILAAADEKLSKFEAMLDAMHKRSSVHSPQISVYSSAFDWPLFASECCQWKLRLGNTYSFFGDSMEGRNWPMVGVVDASGVEYDNVQHHSYHAEAEEVLDDIEKLLKNSDKSLRKLKYFRCGSEKRGWVFHAFVSSQWKHRWNMSEISPEMVISDKKLLT